MKTLTNKNKLILSLLVWIVSFSFMFFWIFPKQNLANIAVIDSLNVLKEKRQVLEIEKNTYLKAKQALEDLEKKELLPESFFSKNITLVNEIKKLENLGADLGIVLTLSGISGTLQSVAKAPTVSEIYLVPYSINLEGRLDKIVTYIEYLENLEYINSINQLNISATKNGEVNANLSANFYILK